MFRVVHLLMADCFIYVEELLRILLTHVGNKIYTGNGILKRRLSI